ncbi:uncharacterized protein Tco025E_09488 [Trypanosoma conorhini]|uniref:Uncharacterized protein n=1 Tax=Trypanosoma conorhini TaxID=83891 RepID=A0A3R7N6G6_9TRYP|nr:uncharacterized protein Tco025E_09488 [Trypanosoma conorhini]RNE97322.1 hypothetical protein Tco025E_09488 [Trypanosoma conorhini]
MGLVVGGLRDKGRPKHKATAWLCSGACVSVWETPGRILLGAAPAAWSVFPNPDLLLARNGVDDDAGSSGGGSALSLPFCIAAPSHTSSRSQWRVPQEPRIILPQRRPLFGGTKRIRRERPEFNLFCILAWRGTPHCRAHLGRAVALHLRRPNYYD